MLPAHGLTVVMSQKASGLRPKLKEAPYPVVEPNAAAGALGVEREWRAQCPLAARLEANDGRRDQLRAAGGRQVGVRQRECGGPRRPASG